MKKNGTERESVTERSVVSISGTLYVSIPKAFAARHGIKAGDRLPMVLGRNMMKLVPHEK